MGFVCLATAGIFLLFEWFQSSSFFLVVKHFRSLDSVTPLFVYLMYFFVFVNFLFFIWFSVNSLYFVYISQNAIQWFVCTWFEQLHNWMESNGKLKVIKQQTHNTVERKRISSPFPPFHSLTRSLSLSLSLCLSFSVAALYWMIQSHIQYKIWTHTCTRHLDIYGIELVYASIVIRKSIKQKNTARKRVVVCARRF